MGLQNHKKYKHSFLYRIILKFLMIVMIPCFCIWWLYSMILSYQFIENSIRTKQINMENSISLLELSVNEVSNIISAIEGNPEILYYMEYKPYKKEMAFGAYSRLFEYINNLKDVAQYVDKIIVYSDSGLFIPTSRFVDLNKNPLEEDLIQRVNAAKRDEIVWEVLYSDMEEFQGISAFKKIYSENKFDCIGYIEVQLNFKLLEDYLKFLDRILGEQQDNLFLYHGDTLVYSVQVDKHENSLYEEGKTGFEICLRENQYRNNLKYSKLDMYIVHYGHISDIKILPLESEVIIFYGVLCIITLVLFSIFIMDIVSLSKRISDFSAFIKNSVPENLLQYQYVGKMKKGYDEIDEMIDAYNMLIKEKNSLISQVEKLSFYTQEASYHSLQNQIHPHFVYGTLETIRMTALESEDEKVANMIFSFATLFRNAMSYANKDTTLRSEVEIAKHYLFIQKVRFDDRLECVFQVDENLLDMMMPAFVFQPILENAITYGVSNTLDSCVLTLDVHEESEKNCFYHI